MSEAIKATDMKTHSDVSKLTNIWSRNSLVWRCLSFLQLSDTFNQTILFFPFQVVTGATDGIGKQYAKSVSEISSLSGSLFIQFRCLTVINNNFSITCENRKNTEMQPRFESFLLALDGRKTKL